MGQDSTQPAQDSTLPSYVHRFGSMGCPCEIRLYAVNEAEAAAAFATAEAETHRLDLKYSHYRPDSELARIQSLASAPAGWRADEETARLLDFAARQFEESGGRFDITAGHLSALWGRRTE